VKPLTNDLSSYVKARRWFRSKARNLTSARVEQSFALDLGEPVLMTIVLCTYADAAPERYILPMAEARGEEARKIARELPHLVIQQDESRIVYDPVGSERVLEKLLALFASGAKFSGANGNEALVVKRLIEGCPAAGASTNMHPKLTKTEQTNTSIVFGDAWILKIVRKLDEGRSAELEMGDFLTRHNFASSPIVAGAIEIEDDAGQQPRTVGVLHRFVENEGEAWTSTLDAITAGQDFSRQARQLGKRVGEMHVVLAAGGQDEPAFAPRPIDRAERQKLADAVKAELARVARHLRGGQLSEIEARLNAFVNLSTADPIAMRVHGDLHLGQILAQGNDYVLIDFEGEPARSLEERRGKRSPLADVAGMLRSFHYAAATVLKDKAGAWYRKTSSDFLAAYDEATRGTPALVLPTAEVRRVVLDFYLFEKCAYEIEYEANNRPDWIGIPLEGIALLLQEQQQEGEPVR